MSVSGILWQFVGGSGLSSRSAGSCGRLGQGGVGTRHAFLFQEFSGSLWVGVGGAGAALGVEDNIRVTISQELGM